MALRQNICICICMDQRSVSGAGQGCSLGRTFVFVFVFVFVWIKDLYQGPDKVAPWAGHGSCDLIKGRFPLKTPGKSKILRDASGEFSDRTEIHLI